MQFTVARLFCCHTVHISYACDFFLLPGMKHDIYDIAAWILLFCPHDHYEHTCRIVCGYGYGFVATLIHCMLLNGLIHCPAGCCFGTLTSTYGWLSCPPIWHLPILDGFIEKEPTSLAFALIRSDGLYLRSTYHTVYTGTPFVAFVMRLCCPTSTTCTFDFFVF